MFRASRKVFQFFPMLYPTMVGAPCYLLEFSQIILKHLIQTLCNIYGGVPHVKSYPMVEDC